MKIYTRTGDSGSTALFGGTRVPKHHLRIEAYGTVDELNAMVGLLKCESINSRAQDILLNIQNDLFTLGAMLATDPAKATLKSGKARLDIPQISTKHITNLENEMDFMNTDLPEMTHFILPGGNKAVSYCHLARCICRRAERATTALNDTEAVEEVILKYLNRLSDYFFVLARKLAQESQTDEIKWIPKK